MMFPTPILFIIFNRPDVTEKVFDAIRKARPTRLYIAADGPRGERGDDAELVEKTRAITEEVDWDCRIHRLYREDNLGCKHGVEGAIDWFFQNEKEGIILEDDCLPSRSFFTYCQKLLERHRDDSKIAAICGHSKPYYEIESTLDYDFSCIWSMWGWATWADRWHRLEKRPEQFDSRDLDPLGKGFPRLDMERKITACHNGVVDSWDFPVMYAIIKQRLLVTIPARNLVGNIGVGHSHAAHMRNRNSTINERPEELKTSVLRHPKQVTLNQNLLDQWIEGENISFFNHLLWRLKHWVKSKRWGVKLAEAFVRWRENQKY